MDAPAQLTFIASAVDALEDISAQEVAHVSAEIRRSITRHAQIVPEIAKLVAEKRARANRPQTDGPFAIEMRIDNEARERRAKARTQEEVEEAWQWERDERKAAGLSVPPIAPPLTRREIAKLSPAMVKIGLKCGALKERDGEIVNA